MSNLKDVYVLNHTHWDREWYESFDEFRYKLRNGLRFVKTMLEEKKLDYFFLDGQTIVLEDYKEIVDEEEYDAFVELIRQQKIEVGPWYLLADEFLTSGESMLKNLEIGIATAKKLESKHNIGYLPDTFGHISQLPQILKGFNLDRALIFRGAVSSTLENKWVGADGSAVKTYILPLFSGYFQTFLKHDDYLSDTEQYIKESMPYASNGRLLIMNGADHTYPSDNLVHRLEQLRVKFPELNFRQTSMNQFMNYLDNINMPSEIMGEQRNPEKIFILPGVLSTRTYLKVQNQLCEDLAIGVMEALNVWSNGSTNSEAFMTYVWKQILKNQPHDSICGCSIDEVHREMESRTEKVINAIKQFEKDTLNELYPFKYDKEKILNPYIYVIQNNPIAGYYPVNIAIKVPKTIDQGGIQLFEGTQAIPFDLINREESEHFFRHILSIPHYEDYVHYQIKVMLNFDGVETKRLHFKCTEPSALPIKSINQGINENNIENEFYRILFDESGLIIQELQTGQLHKNQNIFVSSLDAGDTYNYSPPINDMLSRAKLTHIDSVVKGRYFEQCIVHYELSLPIGLNEKRTGPHQKYVINTIKSKITLYKQSPLIRFETIVNNVAKDQKLRVGFEVGHCDVSYSDTAFDLVKRYTLRDKQWDMPKNKEAIMNQYPTSSVVFANSFELVHRGLQEYEVDKFEKTDAAFLTLIRGVGWLSRRDLRTRGNGAGPGFETPEAQCLGTFTFNYGVVIGEQHHSLNMKQLLRQEALVQQSYVSATEEKLFKQSSSTIVASSFMQKEKNTFDIRMYNPTSKQEITKIELGFIPNKVQKVDFSGKILMEYDVTDKLIVSFKAKEITTLRVYR